MKLLLFVVLGLLAISHFMPDEEVAEEAPIINTPSTEVNKVDEKIETQTPVENNDIYMTKTNYLGGENEIELAVNPNAIDPTYDQAIEFIRADRTDRNKYIPNKYICGDFAMDVQHNAEVAGYNCAWVYVEFKDGRSHACNAFNTIDRGLVFVDCTRCRGEGPTNQDCLVHVINGEEYTRELIKESNYETKPMGIVKSHEIIWHGSAW